MNNKWKIIYKDLSILKEDMAQIEFWNIILDLWYYENVFKIYIIKDYNWEVPLNIITFTNKDDIESVLDFYSNKINADEYMN